VNVERLVLGPLDTNCYLVSADARSTVVVIDPAGEPELLLEALGGREVATVVLTHCHFDHLGAAAAVVEATGAPLAVSDRDADYITDSVGTGGQPWGFEQVAPKASRRLTDGDTITAGALELKVLETPGHTPGSICLVGEGHVFAGDTLFAGSVGRTDFPRGDGRALAASIATKLAPLPDDTRVHPGHGPDTDIGRERRLNPFFPR